MKAMYGIRLLVGLIMLLPETLWAFAPSISFTAAVSERSLPSRVYQNRRRLIVNKNSKKEEVRSRSSIVEESSGGSKGAALPPSSLLPSSSSTSNINNDNQREDQENANDDFETNTILSQASTAVMISQESKRILIEELGYRRADVERLKPQLAAPIIAKRLRCPTNTALPESWIDSDLERQKRQLENESKYPLKFPLLGMSLVLLGKGLGDLTITLIKVNMDFPGASLSDEFQGVPVVLIDVVCVVLGASLGGWTWKTMQDD